MAIFVTCLSAAAEMPSPVSQAWDTRIYGPTNSVFHLAGISIRPSGDAFAAWSVRPPVRWLHDIVVSRHDPNGVLAWRRHYEPEEDSSDNDVALEIVAHGTNVYVAGTSTSSNGNQRVITLKYRDDGELEWARYYGGATYIDRGSILAVDGSGNAIVAGETVGTNGSLDVLVVKYAPNGNLLWTYSYDAPGHPSDHAVGLKLDAAGNIHLAGTSTGGERGPAIFTLKLDAAGQELWVTREESGFNTGLNANALALDSAGNVITVGSDRAYAVTWKYDANGNREWTAHYRAEEPASMRAMRVQCDNQDNIIVGANLNGAGVNDTVLLQYRPDGQQQWATRIANPTSTRHFQNMDVDAAGSSYVLFSPASDVELYKVAPNGAQLWFTTYDSTNNQIGFFSDNAQFLEVTASEDIFLGVRSFYYHESFSSLVKYTQQAQPDVVTAVVTPPLQVVDPGANVVLTAELSGAGPVSFQWRKTGRAIPGATGATLALTNVQVADRGDYSVVVSNSVGLTVSSEARLSVRAPPQVVVAPDDAVAHLGTDSAFMASVSGNDFVTLQWRHNGTNVPGATNETLHLIDLSADDAGLYDVVASTFGGTGTSSAAGLRISSVVRLVETTPHRSAPSTWEYAPQLCVLPTGEFLIAARSNRIFGSSIVLHKHATNGAILWSAAFDSVEFTNAEPAHLALDGSGNIYLTGLSRQPYLPVASALLKFSPDGQLLWSRLQTGTNQWSNIHAFAVDSDGNSIVGSLGQFGTMVVRYNSAGEMQWALNNPSLDDDTIALAIDSSGNSYLGTTIRAGHNEIRLRKFDSAGATVWTRAYEPGIHHRLGTIAVDSVGHLIVAGIGGPSDIQDGSMFVAKYSPAGQKLWETRVGSSWREIANIVSLAVGPGDDITVSTESDDDYEPGEQSNLTRVRSDGQLMFHIPERQIYVSRPTQLALDSFGNAYVTGFGGRPASGVDAVTAKYDAHGSRHWLVYHSGPGGENWEYGLAVGVDAAADVRVLTTEGFGSDTGADFSVLHYRQRDPAGRFRLQLIPSAGGTFHLGTPNEELFRIEASTDLQDWSVVTESAAQELLQPGATSFSGSPQRFFRLILAE